MAASAQKESESSSVRGTSYFNEGIKRYSQSWIPSTLGMPRLLIASALEIKPEDFHWQFNLADAIYKQKKGRTGRPLNLKNLADKAVKPN